MGVVQRFEWRTHHHPSAPAPEFSRRGATSCRSPSERDNDGGAVFHHFVSTRAIKRPRSSSGLSSTVSHVIGKGPDHKPFVSTRHVCFASWLSLCRQGRRSNERRQIHQQCHAMHYGQCHQTLFGGLGQWPSPSPNSALRWQQTIVHARQM